MTENHYHGDATGHARCGHDLIGEVAPRKRLIDGGETLRQSPALGMPPTQGSRGPQMIPGEGRPSGEYDAVLQTVHDGAGRKAGGERRRQFALRSTGPCERRAHRRALDPADGLAGTSARRKIAGARFETHIKRVPADAPPLTGDQRDRIASLLREVER